MYVMKKGNQTKKSFDYLAYGYARPTNIDGWNQLLVNAFDRCQKNEIPLKEFKKLEQEARAFRFPKNAS